MTLNTREVAQEARAHAIATGAADGVKRGRLSRETFVAYFVARPQRARQVAAALGIEVSKRGRLSETHAKALATLVR